MRYSTQLKKILLSSHNGGICFIWWKLININPQEDHNSYHLKTDQFSKTLSESESSTQLLYNNSKPVIVSTSKCCKEHEGRQLLHIKIPINIDTLYDLLFSNSKFMDNFHSMRHSSDIVYGDWMINEEGQRVRMVDTTVKTDMVIGPKTTKVTEKQIIRTCSRPGELYSIDIDSQNAGIPYADSFKVDFHYCLVRTADNQTLLSVHARINFMKKVISLAKHFIESHTWPRLDDFFQDLADSLQRELNMSTTTGEQNTSRHLQVNRMDVRAPKTISTEENRNTSIERVLDSQPTQLAKGMSVLMMCFTCVFCFVYLKS